MNELDSLDLELELQHIYLEVHAERYAYLRQFVESYYCFRFGLVTKRGRADWQQILTYAPRSCRAKQERDQRQLVRVLSLPLSVLSGKLKALMRDEALTTTAIQAVLNQYLSYVVITRQEWAQLNQAGLSERMPAGYYQPTHADFLRNESRWHCADIRF